MRRIKTLKLNYEFKNVLTKGEFAGGKQVLTYTLDNKKGENRLGIAVSKKTAKAVKRNRIKRVIRAAYQEVNREAKQGKDIVFVWNKNEKIENLDFNIVSGDIKKAFLKLGLI